MVCIATIVSVLVVNLARNQHVTPLPWLLKNLLTGWLGQILCLGHVTGQVQCILCLGHVTGQVQCIHHNSK